MRSKFLSTSQLPGANCHCRIIKYLQQAGFYKEGEVTFPHKQSAVMKIKRDYWEAPAL